MARRNRQRKDEVVKYDYFGTEIKTRKIWEGYVGPFIGYAAVIVALCGVAWFVWLLIDYGNFWPIVLALLILFLIYLLGLGSMKFVDQVSNWNRRRAEMKVRNKGAIETRELRILAEKVRLEPDNPSV